MAEKDSWSHHLLKFFRGQIKQVTPLAMPSLAIPPSSHSLGRANLNFTLWFCYCSCLSCLCVLLRVASIASLFFFSYKAILTFQPSLFATITLHLSSLYSYTRQLGENPQTPNFWLFKQKGRAKSTFLLCCNHFSINANGGNSDFGTKA